MSPLVWTTRSRPNVSQGVRLRAGKIISAAIHSPTSRPTMSQKTDEKRNPFTTE
jgi:hypothetical protein